MPRDRGILARPLLKRDIEIAKANSQSASGAARFLKVTYKTYRKYAMLYGIFETNPTGKGISRKGVRFRGAQSLNEILEGKYPNYDHKRLRDRIVRAGLLPNECALCGYKQARPNGRVPLLIYVKDGNRKNLRLDNLELRCYNCTYVTTGRFQPKYFIGPDVFEADLMERITEDIDLEKLQEEAQQELEEKEHENVSS